MKRWLIILGTYALAGGGALTVLQSLNGRGFHPLVQILVADAIATCLVFGVSMMVDNSSIYDPYWSIAPIFTAMWLASDPGASAPLFRQVLVVGLTFAWGARLTYNWARTWDSLDREDWRYKNIRERTGALYWPVSFLGIHLFPTLMTFLGCLPMWYAATAGDDGFGVLDIVATAVVVTGIVVETVADRQLLDFVESEPEPGAICKRGLWAWSRHPNYFGEIVFWWGIALFGVAAAHGEVWFLVGAVAITVMFLTVSLPMIEKRMRERRDAWDEHAKHVPLLVPLPPKNDA